MNLQRVSILSLALCILLAAGCSQRRPASNPRPAAPGPEVSSRVPLPVPPGTTGAGNAAGHYAAMSVTGDYAAYPDLERFIDKMERRHGFSRDYLYGLFSQAQRKEWTINYMNREAPQAAPRPGAWSRYRAKFLDDLHISAGASFWANHASALERARAEYGVSPEHIMGIMGVETIYGRNLGTHRVIDALTTLAFDYPRRSEYFTGELESFLIMARDEGIDPSEPVGSFAGAMGLGQFMPSSFLKYAVDFDGDGRRDLWNPVDAIGSIANYFVGHGWRSGEPVVNRAVASSDAARGLESGFDTQYSAQTLAAHGIQPDNGESLADGLRLLRLSTNGGDEYWLGHDNFYVITRYNHSTHYAMAVHQLAQAIKRRVRG